MKYCYRCKTHKSFQEFNKHKKQKDGLKRECRECAKLEMKVWRAKRPGVDKQYREENKEKVREAVKKYRSSQKGRAKHAEIEARRRAIKNMAQPKWLTKKQLEEISSTYALAAELSWLSEGGLSVDHIVPLNGGIVCGLHVPWNLQIIPLYDNIKKSNKLVQLK